MTKVRVREKEQEAQEISIEEKLYKLAEESLQRKTLYGREKNDLMREILLLIATGFMLPAALLVPNLPMAMNPILQSLSGQCNARKRDIIKSIQALKRRALIKKLANKITITPKGKKELFKKTLQLVEIKKQKNWDGKWRLIIFDIPEKFHNARNALRQKIKEIGLYQLQRSVYIYPYPFSEEIDLISQFFNIYEFLIYLETNKIEGEQFLLQHFNLEKSLFS
jgi:hypothetical protein